MDVIAVNLRSACLLPDELKALRIEQGLSIGRSELFDGGRAAYPEGAVMLGGL
jgi:hypothetical protein